MFGTVTTEFRSDGMRIFSIVLIVVLSLMFISFVMSLIDR